jgi:GAF domain/Phosphoserine phosphatase RsbU, N-terminal domain
LSGFGVLYLDSMRAYVRRPCEDTLRTAYELGRDAVQRELSVLDLAIAHHDGLARALTDEPAAPDEQERLVRAAGDFFLESLSAFDMVQRGFREARDSALVERRHSAQLRQLSDFLADVSLAAGVSDSLDEMLRLVAEQARELIPAVCCIVAVGSEDNARTRVASYPEDSPRWQAFVRWVDLSPVGAMARAAGRPIRLSAEEIGPYVEVPAGGSTPALILRDWLAAQLTALDGRPIGSVHMVNGREGGFSELDQAVLEHLAQMSSAAVERARHYGGERSSHPRM